MSTVSSRVECRQCHYDGAFYDVDCRTLDEDVLCPRCGYRYYSCPVWEDSGDGQGEQLKRNADGLIVSREESHEGYGAWCIKSIHGADDIGRWEKRPAPAEISDFQELLSDPNVDLAGSFATAWNDESKTLEVVVGQIPDRYADESEWNDLPPDADVESPFEDEEIE